jgi:general secretion pathway protein G
MDSYRLWRVCDLYSSYGIVSPQVTGKHRNLGERYPLLVLRPSLPVANVPNARDELRKYGNRLGRSALSASMPGGLLGQTSHTGIVLGDIQMRKHKGFTLIELVVVVMILGILAAVAAPKLLGTSSSASDNGLKETLGVVRDAIERYTAEHGGTLPAQTNTLAVDLLPYIRVFPKSPITNTNTVKLTTTAGPMTGSNVEAWQYNKADGGFICNSTGLVKSDPAQTATYDSL